MNNEKEKSRTPDFTRLLIYSILLFISIFLISCSDDNPIKPPPTPNIPDTVNKYEWTLDTIFGYNCKKIYSADSYDVFISAYPAPLFYDGIKYTEINMMDPLFICDIPAGYDKNNVFFGGGKSGTYLGDPILKKWNNGIVNTYTMSNDSGVSICDIYVLGPNECWLSTSERYKIYHFSTDSIISYSLDSGQSCSVFYKNGAGILHAVSFRYINNDYSLLRVYKFENNNFISIRSDTVKSDYFGPGIARCGNDLLYAADKEILFFDGDKWSKLCDAPVSAPYSNIGGISKENFFCYGRSDSGPWQIYVYEGNKWTMEGSKNIYHYLALGADISVTPTDVNIIYNSYNGINIHMKGKRKAFLRKYINII